MKKNVCILTATRAEYGLLKPIILRFMAKDCFEVRLVVTGSHLSPEFGMTFQEIERDLVPIDKKIEILLSSDTPSSISKSMGLAILGFADYFSDYRPDLLIVLGDRYETLSVCCAAMNERIPIAHLYGGESTEGAVDEACRHAITKLSYLHFTSTENYRNRVIQLGEDPSRVFNVGALGVENVLNQTLLERVELERRLNFELRDPYVVVTYHPVTLEAENNGPRFQALLDALDSFPKINILFTKANADAGGRIINEMIDEYVSKHINAKCVASLGVKLYLSAVKYSAAVIGNSSSGIVEVPSFHVPTINIGDRQKGRLMAESVVNCIPLKDSIINAIERVFSDQFLRNILRVSNPYEKDGTSRSIVNKIENFLLYTGINLKKTFYDIY
jgi:GDP/UDP-N,N'-diacetylbacillosamine 2-epimerase (hydrolysing)